MEMSDFQGALIVITMSLVVFLTVYVFASFSYQISQDRLKMKRRILVYIPVNCCKIKIKNIQEVRRFDLRKDLPRGGYIFGNLFRKKGVIIILKRWSLFGKRMFISPENPEKFIEQINNIMMKGQVSTFSKIK